MGGTDGRTNRGVVCVVPTPVCTTTSLMSNSNDDRCLVRANLGVFGVDPTGEDKGFPPGVKDEDAAA